MIFKREKEEDNSFDAYDRLTDDETTPPTITMIEINEDDSVRLTPSQSAKKTFPPGCPVWYDLKKSSSNKGRLDATCGVVATIYIHMKSMRFVFGVVSSNVRGGNNGADKEEEVEQYFFEDQLAFAMNCSVYLKKMDAHDPSKCYQGVILCPKRATDKSGGEKLTYTVAMTEGKNVRLEMGVEPSKVVYRKVEVEDEKSKKQGHKCNEASSTSMDDKLEGGGNDTKALNQKGNSATSLLEQATDIAKEESGDVVPSIKGGENSKPSGSVATEGLQSSQHSSTIEHTSISVPNNTHDQKEGTSQTSSLSSASARKSDAATSAVTSSLDHSADKNHPSDAVQHVGLKRSNSATAGGPNKRKRWGLLLQRCNSLPSSPHKQQNEEIDQDIIHPSLSLPESTTMSEGPARDANQKSKTSQARWEPPSSSRGQAREQLNAQLGDHVKLTVPSWAINSSSRSLFHHITGRDGSNKGDVTKSIETQTGCTVDITRDGTAMYLTLTPKRGNVQYDLAKALTMMGDSLVDFLDCAEAKVRLLYELAMLLEGTPLLRKNDTSGIAQQRYRNKLVWMKLLDLADFKREDLVLFREHAQQLVQQKAQSSVLIKVFSGSKICKSFTLVCGDSSDEVERSANIVNDMMMAYQRDEGNSNVVPDDTGTSSNAPVAKWKTGTNQTSALPQTQFTPRGGASALEQEGKQLSWKPRQSVMEERQNAASVVDEYKQRAKTEGFYDVQQPNRNLESETDGMSIEHPRKAQKDSGDKCVLTVPLWVMQRCSKDNDLFEHFAHTVNGKRNYQINMIQSETGCSLRLSRYNSKEGRPMSFTIKSGKEVGAILRAKKMTQEHLLDFLDDENAEGRLLHELAATLESSNDHTNKHYKCANGLVRQDSHTDDGIVWMAVLELPYVQSKRNIEYHGVFLTKDNVKDELIAGADCSIEVYAFGDNIPSLCDPYVLVSGRRKEEVNIVAENVRSKLLKHMSYCGRCEFSEDVD